MVFEISRAWTPPEKKTPKAQMSIWDRGIEDLLANVEISITQATGRYQDGEPYAKPKASKCWRVLPKMANPAKPRGLENELCAIYLKAGGVKLPILKKKGAIVTETEVVGMALRDQLVDIKTGLEKIKRNSGAGKDLFEALKAAYKPKKDAKDYKFDAKSERWVKK